MNRRSFLKLAAASSAAVGFPSIVRAETLGLGGGVAPSNRITLGVIGTGSQGSGIMRNALNNGKTRVIALCDVDSGHVEGARRTVDGHYRSAPGAGASVHRDFREITSRKDIDGVLIATPDHWHALTTIAAANAGKHVYCEKPAATSIPESRAMLDAVERSGIVCQIGSMQRSQSPFQRAVDLARGGYLGKITRIQVNMPTGGGDKLNPNAVIGAETPPKSLDYDMWVGPAPMIPYHSLRCHWEWRWNFNFGGGQLADWIEHHYDIASVVMGVNEMQPVAIEKVTWKDRPSNPLYDTPVEYGFEAHYANGVIIECRSTPSNRGLRIEGTEGWVHADRPGIEHGSDALGKIVIPSQNIVMGRGAGGSHMDNFIECIPTGATPRCPMRDAHCVSTVAHLANAAIRSGRGSLKWNPGSESLVGAPEAERFITRTYRAPWALPA